MQYHIYEITNYPDGQKVEHLSAVCQNHNDALHAARELWRELSEHDKRRTSIEVRRKAEADSIFYDVDILIKKGGLI